MGLGWEIIGINGEIIITHSGSDPGVKALVFFLPRTRMGMVVLTNGENGRKVIREVVRTVYPNPVFIKQSDPLASSQVRS